MTTDWLNRCHFGDVRAVLRRMAADGVRVQTIVTSPPYWGLRSYLPAGHADKVHEIGSEPTLREFIDGMVGVFELCRAVLADDGTMFVNMGDSYLPGKQLAMQPHRLAIALQDAGWCVRQDIVWHKPNPMPESTRDRCTKAHEFIFLLSKKESYYFDQDAIRTPLSAKTTELSYSTFDGDRRAGYKMPDGWNTGAGAHGSFHPEGREAGKLAHGSAAARKARASAETKSGPTDERNGMRGTGVGWGYAEGEPKPRTTSKRNSFARETKNTAGEHGQKAQHRPERDEVHYANSANKRSVWTVATEAYPGSHFATFPTKLIEPCILAGCPAGGTVLDIFFGSGTTGQVAQALGRNFIGIELNQANEPLQRQRLRQPSLLLEVTS